MSYTLAAVDNCAKGSLTEAGAPSKFGLASVPLRRWTVIELRELDPAYEHKDQNNNQDETQDACGSWSPRRAITPGRERPDQQKHQDYQKDGSKRHISPPQINRLQDS